MLEDIRESQKAPLGSRVCLYLCECLDSCKHKLIDASSASAVPGQADTYHAMPGHLEL